jgi:hypothetical protein
MRSTNARESITRPKCFSKFFRVASCSSCEKDALQSDKNTTLKSRMAPSRAVLSQQTLVTTPVIAMVSPPSARNRFSHCRKAAVAKLLDQDIVLRRLQRLVDFRARCALEVAPFIIGIMGLWFDVGKNADVGQVFALGRVQVNDGNFSIMTISQQFLDPRDNIFRGRQITSAARMHPDVLHVDDNHSGIRRSESSRFRRAALHFVHNSNSW